MQHMVLSSPLTYDLVIVYLNGADCKESACNIEDLGSFNPWVREIPWRREWPTTLVFLPGESHGQRKLVGYSAWGCKELDTTE